MGFGSVALALPVLCLAYFSEPPLLAGRESSANWGPTVVIVSVNGHPSTGSASATQPAPFQITLRKGKKGVPVHGFWEKGISTPKIGHPFLPTFSIFRFHLGAFSVSSVSGVVNPPIAKATDPVTGYEEIVFLGRTAPDMGRAAPCFPNRGAIQ